jgi:hypothetical protein
MTNTNTGSILLQPFPGMVQTLPSVGGSSMLQICCKYVAVSLPNLVQARPFIYYMLQYIA